jgi:hypothetical protein
VTHQKRTMEIAAMMYGISLNKDGTTKVVAQQHEHPTTLESDSRLEGGPPVSQASTEEDPVIEVPQSEPVG